MSAEGLRAVMRHSAAAVSVVTTAYKGELAGMTISSLASLSLRPRQLVSLNMQVPSRTARLLHASGGQFAVNIMSQTPESISLARAFAGQQSLGHDFNPFEGFPDAWELLPSGIPLLRCAMAHLECLVDQTIAVQDHEILVARVTEARCHDNRLPLLYHNHAFTGLCT